MKLGSTLRNPESLVKSKISLRSPWSSSLAANAQGSGSELSVAHSGHLAMHLTIMVQVDRWGNDAGARRRWTTAGRCIR